MTSASIQTTTISYITKSITCHQQCALTHTGSCRTRVYLLIARAWDATEIRLHITSSTCLLLRSKTKDNIRTHLAANTSTRKKQVQTVTTPPLGKIKRSNRPKVLAGVTYNDRKRFWTNSCPAYAYIYRRVLQPPNGVTFLRPLDRDTAPPNIVRE